MRARASINTQFKLPFLIVVCFRNMTELKADKLQAQANRVTCLIESSIPSQDQQLSNLCAKSRANSTALDTQTSLLLRLTRTVSSYDNLASSEVIPLTYLD